MAFDIDIKKIHGISHPNNRCATQTIRKLKRKVSKLNVDKLLPELGSIYGGKFIKDLCILEKE